MLGLLLVGVGGCAGERRPDTGDVQEEPCRDFRAFTVVRAGTFEMCSGTTSHHLDLWCEPGDPPLVIQGAGMDVTTWTVWSEREPGSVDLPLSVYGCTVEVRDLTITGGYAEMDPSCWDTCREPPCCDTAGAGFDVDHSDVTFTRVAVRANEAPGGGGAGLVQWGTVRFVDSVVEDNDVGGVDLQYGGRLTSIRTQWHGQSYDVGFRDPSPEATWRADGATDFTCDAATAECKE